MHQILQVRIDKDKLDKLDDYRQTVEKSITYIPSNRSYKLGYPIYVLYPTLALNLNSRRDQRREKLEPVIIFFK